MIEIAHQRKAKMIAAIRSATQQLSEDEFLEVVGELGYQDWVSYSPAGKLQIQDVNDMQLVAMAAALLAYCEIREARGDRPNAGDTYQ